MKSLINSENISFSSIHVFKEHEIIKNVIKDKRLYIYNGDTCVLVLEDWQIRKLLDALDIDKDSYKKYWSSGFSQNSPYKDYREEK